jgi:Zn-dependent protease/CBS domain-containing protein
MNDSIRFGSIRGIRIGVNWSVLVVAWLLAWGLASRLLPAAAPGAPPPAYWLAGGAIAAMFFASLLAHELAHAFFALRAGIRVEGITLWLLGGVAKLEGEAPTPGHELRIAASGPITSAVLGAGFGALAMGLTVAGVAALVAESAAWLARVNLILAVFNLLPGAPLDGGRIVRAIAWRLGRDRLRASLLASALGRALGFGLIAFGSLELFGGADLGGLWTIVIGLFMTSAAAAERDHEVTRSALDGVLVRDAMTADPRRVPASLTVDVFVESVMVAERQPAALAVDAPGVVVGVVGAAQVAGLKPAARREARLRDIALPIAAVPTASPDEPLLEVMQRLGPSRAGFVLVADGGEIAGIVAPTDVARVMQARLLRAPGSTGAPGPVKHEGGAGR